MLDRSAGVVPPKKQLLDWVNSVDDSDGVTAIA
jgi:hypothetical protein